MTTFLDFIREVASEKKEIVAKHYGPGPHKGTGTPQKIHAGARQRKGTPKVLEVGRGKYKLGNGITVTTLSTTDPDYKIHTKARLLGRIQYKGQTVDIVGRAVWNERTITAKERDVLIRRGVLPALQRIPPEHLKGLSRIDLDPVQTERGGRYHAEGEYGPAWVEIDRWSSRLRKGNPDGIAKSVKHEIGHHVWENVLSDKERVAYAKALGIDVSPKGLTTSELKYSLPELKKTIHTEIAPDIPRISYYGQTNVFEDFAEFYKGWDWHMGKAEKGWVSEEYDDMPIEFDVNQNAFAYRKRNLPGRIFRG